MRSCVQVWLIVVGLGVVLSCQGSRKQKAVLLSHIDSLERAIFHQTSPLLTNQLAGELIALYDRYVSSYPKDSLSAEFLLEKANFERFLGKPKEALHTLGRLKQEYPSHPRAPYAYLTAALIYDEDLKMPDSARLQIEQLLQKYPDFEQREVAEQLLQVIGKPPEALLDWQRDTLKAQTK